jgi:starch phosphorylase
MSTIFYIEAEATLPAALSRLSDLANNLYYAWNSDIRSLFARLDPVRWRDCGDNPKIFLRQIDQARLDAAVNDEVYMASFHRALSVFDHYRQHAAYTLEQGFVWKKEKSSHLHAAKDCIAYFCAEFGLHESMAIYSGGLGILAGDHCKAASDLGLPFVAVGLLYRQGYFTQRIDKNGQQQSEYPTLLPQDLAIEPAKTASGSELILDLELAERRLKIVVWKAQVGNISLLLLDADHPDNSETDRKITHQLYGGDRQTRLEQEWILGVGGLRALRALGVDPTVLHINEGHAAFVTLEHCREWLSKGYDFETAWELASSAQVFTTHTPVPAGHDIFDHHLLHQYLHHWAETNLHISFDKLCALGGHHDPNSFNMTSLALRGSRHCNGVSRIHGRVASEMESYIWPDISPEENPMSYITNGVHLDTFLANTWKLYFDSQFSPEWRKHICDRHYWSEHILKLPDYSFWSIHQELKSQMLRVVQDKIKQQYQRHGFSEAHIKRLFQYLNPEKLNVLTIGFARRFATYKRATLLFNDLDRICQIVNDSKRPVVFLFAGKAHPKDQPGQQLIRDIQQLSRDPRLEGKIFLIENYDMALARKLISGCDVWLNNPIYPLEASGTSGQKAGMNGVINLSVLDGWWGEGYTGDNGWAIPPSNYDGKTSNQDVEEAKELLDILEYSVIPEYYQNDSGHAATWVERAKNAMLDTIPRFNAQRMVEEYLQKAYAPASNLFNTLQANSGKMAKDLADWRQRVFRAWPAIHWEILEAPARKILSQEKITLAFKVFLNGLSASDVRLECLFCSGERHQVQCMTASSANILPLSATETHADGGTIFRLSCQPPLPGRQQLRFRLVPYHPVTAHPYTLGLLHWL